LKINHTLFPLSLATDVIRILQAKDSDFIRYADLGAWPGKWPSRWDYRREHTVWQLGSSHPVALGAWLLLRSWAKRVHGVVIAPRALDQGTAVPQILLQHDADDNPECTVRLMQVEREMGVVSSCYFFHRVGLPGSTGDQYPLDVPVLQDLERSGFEIGYHQNAYERSDYDLPLAEKLVAEDVEFYRKHFRLSSYVPHGGKPGPQGRNNEHLPPIPALQGLIWAYSGGGVCTDAHWSDGHVEFPEARELQDPRKFAHGLSGRVRARLLLHPQYYGDTLRSDWSRFTISEQSWWRALWNL